MKPNLPKKNKQTDRQTDKHMDKSTYRKHRPGGPMLFKKKLVPLDKKQYRFNKNIRSYPTLYCKK